MPVTSIFFPGAAAPDFVTRARQAVRPTRVNDAASAEVRCGGHSSTSLSGSWTYCCPRPMGFVDTPPKIAYGAFESGSGPRGSEAQLWAGAGRTRRWVEAPCGERTVQQASLKRGVVKDGWG